MPEHRWMAIGGPFSSAAALVLLFGSPALAQDAGSLLRQQQIQAEQDRTVVPAIEEDTREAAGPLPTEDAILLVTRIRFTAMPRFSVTRNNRRSQVWRSANGSGCPGLEALRDEVTATLQQKGYLLARALLPPQDVTEGVVSIEISQGRLANTRFERQKGVRVQDGLLDLIASSHISADTFRKSDLETALLRINDLPGVEAQARLAPGEEANTSELAIAVGEGPVFAGTAWADNYGDAATGRSQATAVISMNDVTGFAEKSQLRATVSEGMFTAGGDLLVPAGPDGLFFNGSYSYLTYRNLTATGQTLGLTGYSHQGTLGAQWRAVRTRDVNVTLDAGITGKAIVDDSTAGRLSEKLSLSTTFGISGDVRDRFASGAITQWQLDATLGELDLSGVPAAQAADAAGLNTQGSFARVNAGVSRLQYLPYGFSLYANASGQWASKNLDSSEEFSLGGPYGVRAWPVGEARGDMGVLGTIELRYDLPVDKDWGDIQLSAFIDAGHLWIDSNPGAVAPANQCGCNDYSLYGAGFGVNWTLEHAFVSASWSHALGGNPGASAATGANSDGGFGRQAFWVRAGGRF